MQQLMAELGFVQQEIGTMSYRQEKEEAKQSMRRVRKQLFQQSESEASVMGSNFGSKEKSRAKLAEYEGNQWERPLIDSENIVLYFVWLGIALLLD